MKKPKNLLLLLSFLTVHTLHSQNLALKKELDSIYVLDQKYRELLSSDIIKTKADSIAKSYNIATNNLTMFLWTEQQKIDSLNMIRIKQIVEKYGYPGQTLVGTPTNETVFFVIQHSQEIDKYLPLLEKAALKKELPFKRYAMMLDRSLMYQGKEQIYGTQAKGFEALNPQTGQKEWKMIMWPIKNAKKVNKRRKKAGFSDTVEENAKRMGITYTIFTIEDFNKMRGQ